MPKSRTDPPLLSVVMPTFNGRAHLAGALAGLEGQRTDGFGFELVVVDDGSRDGTADWLRARPSSLALRVIGSDRNTGRAAARNRGIAAARGEIIVFLDDDIEAAPDLLAEFVRAHAGAPRLALMGNVVARQGVGNVPLQRYLDTRGVHKLGPGERPPARYFLTNNASVRRLDLIDVGLFDETFSTYGFEDMELAFRLEDAGVEFRYVAAARASRLDGQTVEELCQKRYACGRGSLRLIADKHPGRRADLKLDAFDPIRWRHETPGSVSRKMLARVFLHRATFKGARWIVEHVDAGRLAFPLYDLMIAYCYRAGLRDEPLR